MFQELYKQMIVISCKINKSRFQKKFLNCSISIYTRKNEIIEDYIPVRLEYYQKRKKYQIGELERLLIVLSN